MKKRQYHIFRIIKRVAAALLSVVLIVTSAAAVFPAAFAEDAAAPVQIASAEDLQLLAEQTEGSFVLTSDIDMSGIDWTPVPFRGTLDGAGHGIYNLKVGRFGADTAPTVDGNDKVYDSVAAGLFSILDGAVIKDLTIRGADIEVRGEQHCFAGVLAGWMENTVISGCVILDSRVTLTAACSPEPGVTDNGKPRTSCNAGVGGIAGFGSASVSDCVLDVTLVFDDRCDPSLKVEEFLGGIVSTGCVDVYNCRVDIHGYASCRGYAHNGGLVGMLYDYGRTGAELHISGCNVTGSIRFFEDNRDRRAYCDPYVGEKMTWPVFSGNTNSFRNDEVMDYSAPMSPERCAVPQITDNVIPGGCSSWGCTVHTCAVCGNTWKDSFTPKVHDPGDWEDRSFAVNGLNGLRVRVCRLCGQIVEEQILLVPQKITLEPSALEISYKESVQLTVNVEPSDAWVPELIWMSSDETVATVSADGTVTATGRGECVISCSTPDGYAGSRTTLTVSYTVKQWLIRIFLFGWIWY